MIKRFLLTIACASAIAAKAAAPACLSVHTVYKSDPLVVQTLVQTLAGNLTNMEIGNTPSFVKVDVLFQEEVVYMNGTSAITAQQWEIGVYNRRTMSETAATCGGSIRSITLRMWVFDHGSMYSKAHGFITIAVP